MHCLSGNDPPATPDAPGSKPALPGATFVATENLLTTRRLSGIALQEFRPIPVACPTRHALVRHRVIEDVEADGHRVLRFVSGGVRGDGTLPTCAQIVWRINHIEHPVDLDADQLGRLLHLSAPLYRERGPGF